MEPKTLLLTVHGSRLYGLSHELSDEDFYRVIDAVPPKNEHGDVKKRNGQQTVADSLDDTVFDLKTFMIHAYAGVPQALEAMFSPVATIDVMGAYRAGFRVSVQSMSAKYIHAIEKFSQFDFKRRRHALRYALNLQEAINNAGRFSPVLSESDKLMISEMAMDKNYIQHLRNLSYFELNLNEDVISESLRK
jgi:predicted nucleotidyltransferase